MHRSTRVEFGKGLPDPLTESGTFIFAALAYFRDTNIPIKEQEYVRMRLSYYFPLTLGDTKVQDLFLLHLYKTLQINPKSTLKDLLADEEFIFSFFREEIFPFFSLIGTEYFGNRKKFADKNNVTVPAALFHALLISDSFLINNIGFFMNTRSASIITGESDFEQRSFFKSIKDFPAAIQGKQEKIFVALEQYIDFLFRNDKISGLGFDFDKKLILDVLSTFSNCKKRVIFAGETVWRSGNLIDANTIIKDKAVAMYEYLAYQLKLQSYAHLASGSEFQDDFDPIVADLVNILKDGFSQIEDSDTVFQDIFSRAVDYFCNKLEVIDALYPQDSRVSRYHMSSSVTFEFIRQSLRPVRRLFK